VVCGGAEDELYIPSYIIDYDVADANPKNRKQYLYQFD
jgi:hypothetical protein